MTVKEQIVEIIRAEGYDFITACELATKCIAEFKVSGEQSSRYHIGHTSFTLAKAEGK